MKKMNNGKNETEDLKGPSAPKADNSAVLSEKEASKLPTPEEKRKELQEKGINGDELELFMSVYQEKYKREILQGEDVLKTMEALEYINKHLEEEGLVKHKKDLLTITNLRELTIKPNSKGQLEGRIKPVDSFAAKKIGFHFKKDILDQFIKKEIELRKADKEALFIENEQLKQRVKELEQQLKQLQKESKVNTPDKENNENKANIKLIKDVSLGFDGQELTFLYNKVKHFASFENNELTVIEKEFNSQGDRKEVTKPTLNKLKDAVIETRKQLLQEKNSN